MNGLKYHRLRKRLPQSTLAKQSGVCIPTIEKIEANEHPDTIYTTTYIKLSDALKVTIDDLLRQDYPDDILENNCKAGYISNTENSNNCITVYRHTRRLTFDALGRRLGKTRECARKACARARPLHKHIMILAEYENMSIEKFIDKFSAIDEDAS